MKSILLILSMFLAASQALAVPPPPVSLEELRNNSDVVATVRVLAVLCVGEEKAPNYQAWLQLITSSKGPHKPGETLIVEWQGVPQPIVGPMAPSYLPGEEVATHLKWNGSRRAYTTTPLWNAKVRVIKPSTYGELSKKPGTLMLPK